MGMVLNEHQQFLKDFLENVDKISDGRSIESIVLRKGTAWLTPKIARPKGIRKGHYKMCFMNAFRLAETHRDEGWYYVEGLAISDNTPIPLQHAWVINADGQLIETTWQNVGKAYYGILLDWDFIYRVMLETKTYGVLDPSSSTFRQRYLSNL